MLTQSPLGFDASIAQTNDTSKHEVWVCRSINEPHFKVSATRRGRIAQPNRAFSVLRSPSDISTTGPNTVSNSFIGCGDRKTESRKSCQLIHNPSKEGRFNIRKVIPRFFMPGFMHGYVHMRGAARGRHAKAWGESSV